MGDKVNDVVSSPLLLTEETIAGTLTSPPSLSPTLPFDLIPEILCKLPVKLLLQLRCICKSWNFLISDPNFIKKHFRHSTTHLVHILTYSENFLNSYTIDSVLTDQTAITSKLEFRNHRGVSFVGSCNGILCFLVKKDYENLITIQLWNPSIRKLKVLPPFEKPAFKMYGFGHDPVSDSYKVVVVLDVLDDRRNLVEKQINDVKVHTLGTNLWRNIEKLKFPFVIKPLRRSGIYVSGTINWLVKDHLLLRDCPRKNHYFVVSLDLRNESYKKILLPDYGKVGVGGYSTLHLSVFRDCLCMISRQDVWIRKEYGNPNSWTKLLTISYMQDPSTSWVFTNAMHIFEDGQVFGNSQLFHQNSKSIISRLIKMPPFAGSHPTRTDSNIVTIDVGGQMFQTTKQTLTSAGPKTFFSSISQTSSLFTPFIDRDPEIFSLLLSLLRTGNLPSKAKSFDLQDLIIESQFYGIENLLINSLSNPEQLEPFNLQKSIQLPLNGRDSPSTVATTPYGSLHVAHGSKITTFDWSLRRKSTVLTHFTAVDSLLALSPSLAAAGANDFSGLQILDLENGYVKDTLNWENVTKSGSTVQAIGSSPEQMFVSFESSRRNSNSIVVYDLHSLRPVTEIAHNEIYGADIDSAIPATKLQWIESHNLLMASGSHSGPSGVSGNIRLWDVRSGNVVWEISEKVDCFADVAVSDSLNAMFKIGVNSGETFYMDMKNLGAEKNSWVCLGDKRKVLNGKKEGFGCKIETQGNQVFCTKGGDVELWSEIIMGSSNNRIFKKNLMGRVQDMGGAKITNLAFGGSRMFLTRKDLQCVEVWQSSSREL